MNNLNPFAKIGIVFALAVAAMFAFDKIYTKKITESVVKELRNTYTPGPYQPGFNPDKVNPNAFRQPPQQQQQQPQSVPYFDPLPTPNQWNQQWNQQRY